MNTPEDQKFLEMRDERIAEILKAAIHGALFEAQDLEEQARTLRKYARQIEESTAGERWYELKGILESADIESLSDVSPVNLL